MIMIQYKREAGSREGGGGSDIQQAEEDEWSGSSME